MVVADNHRERAGGHAGPDLLGGLGETVSGHYVVPTAGQCLGQVRQGDDTDTLSGHGWF